MDGERFDRIAKALGGGATRRGLLRGLAVGALAWLGGEGAGATHFDCRHVGKPCKGAGQCCSGVCRRGTCRAHHASTCKAGGKVSCVDPGGGSACELNNTPGCRCYQTTGRAPFCGGTSPGQTDCLACQRDQDCVEKHGFPAGSACVPTGATCVCDATTTLCVKPCGVA